VLISRGTALAIALFLAARSQAATVDLAPCADTTLSENYPSNNFGGMNFINAGTTQNFMRNRGLLRFDLDCSLPSGSRITNAWLVLEVVKQPADGYAFADFELHRLLRFWGEGQQETPAGSPGPGTGAPAQTNEACWLSPLAFSTDTWTGAGARDDFVAAPSSTATIYGTGDSPYLFSATLAMLADLQNWLDDPINNHGWALTCQSEGTDFTARRFGSRENEGFAPRLHLEFEPPPTFISIRMWNQNVVLDFAKPVGREIQLQSSKEINAGWRVIATYPASLEPTQISITNNPTDSMAFYRLRFSDSAR
jgi:hypothetical protein